jgi:hypothetical protein
MVALTPINNRSIGQTTTATVAGARAARMRAKIGRASRNACVETPRQPEQVHSQYSLTLGCFDLVSSVGEIRRRGEDSATG